MRTRNNTGDGIGEIDLTGSAGGNNLEFRTQGGGSILIQTGNDGAGGGGTAAGSAPIMLCKLTTGGQKLVIHFETFGNMDTINWRIRGGDHAAFDLRVDGHPIRPVNVYLGHEGSHPPAPIFRVAR